jgi:hypothetical protein
MDPKVVGLKQLVLPHLKGIITKNGATTFSIMTLSIMTFSIPTLSIMGLFATLGISDT